jgi:hypothetical protein
VSWRVASVPSGGGILLSMRTTSGDLGLAWRTNFRGRGWRAFRMIDSDPAHILVAAESGYDVVATMQLSCIPGVGRHGALRAQIEAARVHEAYRSRAAAAIAVGYRPLVHPSGLTGPRRPRERRPACGPTLTNCAVGLHSVLFVV